MADQAISWRRMAERNAFWIASTFRVPSGSMMAKLMASTMPTPTARYLCWRGKKGEEKEKKKKGRRKADREKYIIEGLQREKEEASPAAQQRHGGGTIVTSNKTNKMRTTP